MNQKVKIFITIQSYPLLQKHCNLFIIKLLQFILPFYLLTQRKVINRLKKIKLVYFMIFSEFCHTYQ